LAEWLRRRYDAEVTWLPFDLHPEYPPGGLPRADLIARYGDTFHHRLRDRFAQDGLEYNPNPDVIPNSFDALRLTELARDLGRHDEIHDRLMDAYWRDGIDIGDPDELRRLLHDLPSDDVERVLATDEYRDRVHASTAEAQSVGINGIPAWVIDGKLLVPGAQPREVFERAFAQLSQAS
jgi:predicted DsbA family dithiol-disulfide isomerase